MKILTGQPKRITLSNKTLQERRFKEVTVGIVVACEDGIVIGADRKVTRHRGTRIKSLEDKIHKLSFKDGQSFLVCCSGSGDFPERAISQIDPCDFDRDCSFYRDVVEGRISRLRAGLADRGVEYDATLLFGTIDVNEKPTIGHITRSGVTELKNQGYFTTGIAAPYAEIVLKDSYSPNMSIQDAKLIVGGLIQKIGEVDNDVEGMDVFSMLVKDNKKEEELTWAERRGIEQEPLSFNFKEELGDLKKAIKSWQEFFKLREEFRRKQEEEGKGKPKKKT